MGIKEKVLDWYWKWVLISDETSKEELFEAYENGIEVVIEETLTEVEKVIDEWDYSGEFAEELKKRIRGK